MPAASFPLHPYSPWLGRPETLLQTLVGRNELLADVLRNIASAAEDGAANHLLLVGPRGAGKTHLLCLTSHLLSGRLRTPPDLPGPVLGWTPLFFAEEQYAELNSLANFLLAAVAKLGEIEPLAPRWRAAASIRNQPDDAVCDWCVESLEGWHLEQGGRLVLLVDNLQRLLPVWDEHDQQRLRSLLSARSWIVLVATAPAVFDEVLGQRAALHDFFEILPLGDLSTDEMLQLMEALHRADGRVEQFSARKKEIAELMPAMQKLTGGNPRLLLFLYEVASRSNFLEIEGALHRLIEELREHFVARFDALPVQPRKVLDALAQMPGPARPTDLAAEARLSVPLVNAQLRRLKQLNYVRPIKLKPGRETRYDVTERLFRIWRQTATVAGRRRFHLLAGMLRLLYTPDQIRTLCAQQLALNDVRPGMDRSEVIRSAEELHHSQAATEDAFDKAVEAGKETAVGKADVLLLAGRYAEALDECEAALVLRPGWTEVLGDLEIAKACLGHSGPSMEALPAALLRAGVAGEWAAPALHLLLRVAEGCLERKETDLAAGLFRSALLVEPFQRVPLYGQRLGLVLRTALEASPGQLPRLVALVRELVGDAEVLELLAPFVHAVDLAERRDPGLLEELFPEVRETVAEITLRIDPALQSLLP